MKKFGVFILACACICASCLTKTEENPLFQLDSLSRVCYVAKSEFEGAEVERSGDLFFNYFSAENANSDLEAIAVQFELSCQLDELLEVLDAEIVSVSEVEECLILCIWTKFGKDSFVVNQKEANAQVAVYDDKIIVGLPAIYTSF